MPSVPLPTGTQESMGGCLANDASSTPDFRLSQVEQTAINQTFALVDHGPHQLWLGGPCDQQPALHLLPRP